MRRYWTDLETKCYMNKMNKIMAANQGLGNPNLITKPAISFAIGIPTINRYDLLKNALARYKYDFPDIDIYIVDNGKQGISKAETGRIMVYEPENNIGVAGSWNKLCGTIFRHHTHAFILNDDVESGLRSAHIRALIKNAPEAGILKSPQQFCSFIISKNTYTLVGFFDEEFFPAYFEDNDYLYRCKLAGVDVKNRVLLNPIVYRNSMTISKDASLNNGYMKNQERYILKWGGMPGEERFTTPFNQ
jgi:GT2 family glycosyltransferase